MRVIAALHISLVVGVALGGEGEGLGPGVQQWDFLELRPGAHMFYWLYFTLADVAAPTERPLVFWLQGGPGTSSSGFGNFKELGVLDAHLNPRESTWVKEVNVAFLDNPVGTGFSYVANISLIPMDNTAIAIDLVAFTRLFLQRNPAFVDTPLYIFSESYGGKMAAEFALELYKAIGRGELKTNFKGVALGDPWVSPIDTVLAWAPFLLQTGVVDYEGYEQVRAEAERTREAVEAGKWHLAVWAWWNTTKVMSRVTANVNLHNILTKVPSDEHIAHDPHTNKKGMGWFLASHSQALNALMNGVVKETLGLPKERVYDAQSIAVIRALVGDFMRPTTHIVEQLLNDTSLQVVVYTAQLDLIVDTPGTVNWVQRLRWPGAGGWQAASRLPLIVDDYVEGYTKTYGNFAFYWILRSGHLVPTDNPAAGLAILRQVTGLN